MNMSIEEAYQIMNDPVSNTWLLECDCRGFRGYCADGSPCCSRCHNINMNQAHARCVIENYELKKNKN